MLEFSISNQLLSRLDATTVVADSENYLECSFQFSNDWANTVAVATFGHSQVQDPISVRIVDGKCTVPHEVIKTYGFQLSVYGTTEGEAGKVCHIPTNVVAVEVEASGTGEGLTPSAPTKSMYDSLMTAILAGEAAVTAAKVSAEASAGAAKGAQENVAALAAEAAKSAENSETSASSSAKDALAGREVWEWSRVAQKVMEMTQLVTRSYAVGSENGRRVWQMSDIPWENGVFEGNYLNLANIGDGRYRVRVNDTWYDVVGDWDLCEKAMVTPSDQAELLGGESRVRVEEDVPEVPKGDEVVEVPETPGGGDDETAEVPGGEEVDPGDNTGGTGTGTGSGDDDEKPEIPGGEEVNPGENTGGDNTGGTVVKPIIWYETLHDVMTLVAGPVTIEDIREDQNTKESKLCRLKTVDATVREVEICTAGGYSAKYYYEQALAAAVRAEAAAARAEAQA